MNKMQDLPLCDLNEVKRTAKRTDSDISGCKFSGEYLESEDLSCLSFINCMFENCTFTDCDFERSSFVDVTFISCDLSNSSLDSSYLSRCEFRSCKLVGAEFKDCSIQGVTFESSNCGYAIFAAAGLECFEIAGNKLSGGHITVFHLGFRQLALIKYGISAV